MKTAKQIFEAKFWFLQSFLYLKSTPPRLPEIITECMEEYAEQFKKSSTPHKEFGIWISVKNKLPDEGSHVLVLYKDNLITDAYYEYESGQHYFFDKPKGASYWEASHWMPLPSPPKSV